jgi:tetratricopeptide (TPR) repeat protein
VKLVCALTFQILLASLAHAEIESPKVKAGLAAYGELDYARAIAILDDARKESLTREEKLAAYQTLALARIALGQIDGAKADFQRLLRVDPSFVLPPTLTPKVRAVFEEAKGQAAAAGRTTRVLPTVSPELSPHAPRDGQPLVVRASYGGGVARKMTLYFRKAGELSWSHVTVDGSDGKFEATVPGGEVRAPGLELHVALLDDAGAAIAAAGSLGQPLSFGIAAPKKPLYKRGWLWGVVGGVVAAGAIAAGLAVGLTRPTSSSVTVNAQ